MKEGGGGGEGRPDRGVIGTEGLTFHIGPGEPQARWQADIVESESIYVHGKQGSNRI
jgi:hypothetical protein